METIQTVLLPDTKTVASSMMECGEPKASGQPVINKISSHLIDLNELRKNA